jgi:hypothetical protein
MERVMNFSNIDWNAFLAQAESRWAVVMQGWSQVMMVSDQFRHWLVNDGSAFSAFVVFLGVCAGVIAYAASGHKKKLSEHRAGYDVECFVRDMVAAGNDAEVARTVYYYIEDMHRIDFPILPEDDLYTVLGVTDEAVRRAMPVLLQSMGREASLGRLMKQLTTVEDLVRFVGTAPSATEYVVEQFQGHTPRLSRA